MSFKERFRIFVSCSGLVSSETLSMYFDCPRKQSMTKSFFFPMQSSPLHPHNLAQGLVV